MTKHSIKSFDPERVAELEAQMWRSYYKHNFPKLLKQLSELFRQQFGVGKAVSLRLAYYAAQAARLYRMTDKLEGVEEYLRKYYRLLASQSSTKLDPVKAAESEMNWWIVHRHPEAGTLTEALAENMAVIYRIPAAKLSVYAAQRAKAMELRDKAAHETGQTPDWSAIEKHLKKAYLALSEVVQK